MNFLPFITEENRAPVANLPALVFSGGMPVKLHGASLLAQVPLKDCGLCVTLVESVSDTLVGIMHMEGWGVGRFVGLWQCWSRYSSYC